MSKSPSEAEVATLPSSRGIARPGVHLSSIVLLFALASPWLAAAQEPPIAAFTPSPEVGCTTPWTVFFTDQSTGPTSWHWDFGDGGSSTAQNPIHSYVTAGDFLVTLTVTNAVGSDEATATISVSIPVADFSGTSLFGCGPLEASFTDESTSTSSLASWNWDFGDGTSSSARHPSHVYDSPGTYPVTLSVTDASGCSDQVTRTDFVQVIGPDPDFGVDAVSGPVPHPVSFGNQTLAGAPIVSWTWSFGDGSASSLQHPDHTYSSAGIFDVSLTAADLDGCVRTVSKPELITVTAIADLSITITDGVSAAVPGQTLTYTLVARNDGPSTDLAAQVNLPFAPAVTGVSWTCLATPGSTCASTGSGDVLDTVSLSPGGSATFTATGTLDGAFFGPLTHTASIQPGPGVVEVAPGDNTATDITIVAPDAVLGIPALPGPGLLVLALLLGAAACLRLRF